MTERLYYDDPELREFDATVLRVEPRGDHTAVWLDRTAFYPTSGGQPFDVGTLDSYAIVDVQDDESGGVVHLLRGTATTLAPDQRIRGAIDWARRFDHMQQHTGQHVLSAVIERLHQARTVSFHLGALTSTIDLDRELTPDQISGAERGANAAIWDDRPVAIRYVSEAEARTLPLRKEPARTGTLRLIDVEGVDLSACGGTHVRRTGAIGQIAVASWERFKGGQRIEFACGGRALSRHAQLRDAATAAVRLLSVTPAELVASIERLQSDLKDARRTLVAAQADLAGYEAARIAGGAETLDGYRVVLKVIDGDAHRLKSLAAAIVTTAGLAAVLVSSSQPVLAVAARGPDVPLSCQDVVAALTRQFGGRGGGKPDLAQCGGLQGTPEAVVAWVRDVIAAILRRSKGSSC